MEKAFSIIAGTAIFALVIVLVLTVGKAIGHGVQWIWSF